jgi:hypothetical protein
VISAGNVLTVPTKCRHNGDMQNTERPTCQHTDKIVKNGIVRCADIACDAVVDASHMHNPKAWAQPICKQECSHARQVRVADEAICEDCFAHCGEW